MLMPHDQYILALKQNIPKSLGDDARLDACPFFHRIRLAAVETGIAVHSLDGDLIPAASECKIEARLGKLSDFDVVARAFPDADAQRDLHTDFLGPFTHFIEQIEACRLYLLQTLVVQNYDEPVL